MPADIACRHCPQVLPTVCSLKVKLSSLALLKNFLVLLNHCIIYQVRFICKSRNFLVLLNTTIMLSTLSICKSRNFLVLLNYGISNGEWQICKSRNFLVLLNFVLFALFVLSAKAEIFLCYSTSDERTLWNTVSAKAEIFLCYSTP